jgi:hypothetical protein
LIRKKSYLITNVDLKGKNNSIINYQNYMGERERGRERLEQQIHTVLLRKEWMDEEHVQ